MAHMRFQMVLLVPSALARIGNAKKSKRGMVSSVHSLVLASWSVATTMRLSVPCSMPTGMTFFSPNLSLTCCQGFRPASSSMSTKSERFNQSFSVAIFFSPGRMLRSSKVRDFALTRLPFLRSSSSSVLGSDSGVRVRVAALKGDYISRSASV